MKLEIPVLGLLCGLLLASCSSSKLPEITDPEALRKDCAVLYQQFPCETKTNNLGRVYVISRGFFSKKKWTPAISSLKPLQVLKDENGIRIFIFANKERIRGYYVFFDQTQAKPTRLILRDTNAVGIYEFEEPMASLTN